MNWISSPPLWVDSTPTASSKITGVRQISACHRALHTIEHRLLHCTNILLYPHWASYGLWHTSAHFNTEHLWSNQSPYVSNLWKRASWNILHTSPGHILHVQKHTKTYCAQGMHKIAYYLLKSCINTALRSQMWCQCCAWLISITVHV